MNKLIVILALLLLSAAAHAGNNTGRVTRIYPQGPDVFFKLSGGCKTTANSAYWKFSIANDIGKAWYAMLLNAASTNKPVVVAFSGSTCSTTTTQKILYVYQNY